MPHSLELYSAAEFSSIYLKGRDTTAEIVSDAQGAMVKRTVLPGGTRVLTEAMPGQRSVSVGFWIPVGSRDERQGHFGSTHFLEHLLFKGTHRRTALDIATAFDAVGGNSNAATSKESTCYYARVIDDDLPMAIEVITDMITDAVIDPQELEQERGVIIEELNMDADNPNDVAYEKFVEKVLGSHELARPIGGTPGTIRAVSREAVWEHYRKHYTPDKLVVTVAGGVEHEAVVRMLRQALEKTEWKLDAAIAPGARRNTSPIRIADYVDATVGERRFYEVREVDQSNILVGCPSINSTDDRHYAMSVLNSILGGGMSSRLFQEVREKRGLAYTAYSFHDGYADAGYFAMYAGTAPSKVDEVSRLMLGELEKLAVAPVSPWELDKAIGQLRGGTVLSLEKSGSRMRRLANAEMVRGEFIDIGENLERIEGVTAAEVRQLAEELSNSHHTTMVVGPKQ